MAAGGSGLFILALTVAMSLIMIFGLGLLDRILHDEVRIPFPAGPVLERVRLREDQTLYADCTGVA